MENKEIVLMDNETVVLFADFVEQKKGAYMGDGCGSVDMCGCD